MTLHIHTKSYKHHLLFVLVIYVWSICHATSGTNVVQCVDKERDALLHFKQGIIVDNCGLIDSWGPTLDCCQWGGIRCNNLTGHVTTLRLPGEGLVRTVGVPGVYTIGTCLEGTVSLSLGKLIHLKYLDLSFNDFQSQSIPKFIGSLSNLRYLNLSNAGFGGIIPSEFGNLSRLSSLDLNCRHNYRSMSVDSLSWVSNLSLLRELDLGGVDLSVATNWASIINNLPLLEVLRMDECILPTKLPPSLSYLNNSKTLHVISLKLNSFDDASIFHWLYNVSRIATTLSYLSLDSNSLSGEIPSFIGTISSLSHLDLGYNNFSGQIPSKIWNLDNLSYLSLAENRLEGPANNTISNLKYLTFLDLSYNKQFQLSRQFVKSLAKLCRLQTLRLEYNNITSEFSEIIDSLSQCAHKSLVSLTLSHNQVWGSIPNIISMFSSLETLSIDNNQLNGTIDKGIGRLSRLVKLDLSSNYLNGIVPRSHFSNLSSLKYLKLSHNRGLTVNLGDDWTPPFQLVWVELSSCMIGPSFPQWLVTQLNIRYLDVSSAGIFDVIPESFWSSMAFTLRRLNLSNNMIHGVLPSSFVSCSLYSLDLSSNKLSGAIPSSLVNNIRELRLNNKKFSQGLFGFLWSTTPYM